MFTEFFSGDTEQAPWKAGAFQPTRRPERSCVIEVRTAAAKASSSHELEHSRTGTDGSSASTTGDVLLSGGAECCWWISTTLLNGAADSDAETYV